MWFYIIYNTWFYIRDETRTIDSFKILKQTEDILILEPEIDNFSS